MAGTDTVKPGVRTTEFWGKSLVQVVLMANAVFDLGIELSDETAVLIVGGLEAAYALGRSVYKAVFGKGAA